MARIGIYRSMLLSPALLMLVSCTDPGETTGIAAMTGGALGAGLGAIVGNQTGDPGSGLAIGAVAGASTGALVGNAIQAQEENIRTQDEAIERQERVIAAQKSELEELRRLNQDNPGYRQSLNSQLRNQYRKPMPVRQPDTRAAYRAPEYRAPEYRRPAQVLERNIPPQPAAADTLGAAKKESYADSLYGSYGTAQARPSSVVKQAEPPKIAAPVQPAISAQEIAPVALKQEPAELKGGTECRQADDEMTKAQAAADTSDKLFHTRRAIRLCPERPAFHQALAEIYLALNRKEDAVFEYEEALKYDPNYSPAKEGMKNISSLGSSANRY